LKITLIGAAIAAAVMRQMGRAGVDFERPVSPKRRRISKSTQRFSRHTPHIGHKEQERAKRCYMRNGILHQMSKRQYEALRKAA